ncbi:MAG: NADH-quinone oxidoreductase subunit J [Deltaproteobacteria bacterium]|jgi:NADH-quinone oxidoreductase subunit J|nr:NADH-quinone oxidoreductase subunit J [Deltaproteobacteria bacterium]
MNDLIGQIFHSLALVLADIEAWLAPYLPGLNWVALLAFAFYVILILSGGLTAILARNLVRATLGLIITFLGVAGMYLLLASPFLALMQLLIYIGAVCVLIFFAIMLTKNTADGEEAQAPGPLNLIYAFLTVVAVLAVAGPTIVTGTKDIVVRLPVDTGSNLGEGLLSMDLLSFELISIILLVAMAGAVYLAWRPQGQLDAKNEKRESA